MTELLPDWSNIVLILQA